MSWFVSQIKNRRFTDESEFSDSFTELAQAVVPSTNVRYQSKERIATMAINEMLRYFKKSPVKMPHNLNTYTEMLDHATRFYGIFQRKVVLEGEWYHDACGVMIGELEKDGSPVVLMPGKLFGYSYYDFSRGKYVRVTKKTAAPSSVRQLFFTSRFHRAK